MRFSRQANLWLSYAFLVLLPLQFAIAGYGVFSKDFEPHIVYGTTLLHLLVLFILIFGAIGRLGWRYAGLALLLNVLFVVQMMLPSSNEAWVQGLHPFLAFSYWPYVLLLLLPTSRAAVASGGETSTTVA